ncbi:thioredoxin domain-containing protein, partial [Limibacillus halophilus]
WQRSGQAAYKEAVLLSLSKMSQGGIYDHLGGGYARYATDEKWLVPHFEKMLYDNAQILDLLTLAIPASGDPFLAERREESVDWMLREMIAEDAEGNPSGAFAATLDADSEGEEGKFYVWEAEEIDRLLGPDAAALFKQIYDVRPSGNWEGKTILNRTVHAERLSEEQEATLAEARKLLFEARAERIWPGWDDKVLADWNGMTVAALARAAFAAKREDWMEAAVRAYSAVAALMNKEGRLKHSWRRGLLRSDGTLDDYAQMIEAALTLHELSGKDAYLEDALAWLATLDRLFKDEEKGGYHITAADAGDLIVRPKHAHDNATPAGNSVLAAQLVRLHFLTGEACYAEEAERCIAAFTGDIDRTFYALPSLVNAAEFLSSGRQIVLIGEPGEAGYEALQDRLRQHPNLHDVVQRLRPGKALPDGHPARGKGLQDGKATAYICQNQSCSLPITDPAAFGEALGR